MPITMTPQQYAEKHARRLKGATEDIRRGVAAVTVSPTIKAAESQDKMLSRLQESVQSGKWARGLRRVTLEEWKSKTLDKGIGRIAAGIDAAQPKMIEFATDLLAYENTLMGEVERLPDLTLEDSISRMTHWVRGMAKFQRS